MATEIEAKVRIDDPAAVMGACERLGAVYLGRWRQRDRFFDHPDRRLLEGDRALRLRVNEPLDDTARARGATAQLTYKGPRLAGWAKVRQEHEVDVSDPEALSRILVSMDYVETFGYEKSRRLWRVGATEVTVDEVPGLGVFVEVEAPDEASVETMFERLGLGDLPRITESYVRMLFARKG